MSTSMEQDAVIRQRTYTVTVLYEHGDLDASADLGTVLKGIDSGPMVGQINTQSDELVPAAEVRGKLLEMGNDGEFFGHE